MKPLQLWTLALPWLLVSCQQSTMPQHLDPPGPSEPRAGDLLLLDLECPECDAIAAVTKAQFGVDGPALSHVGLVVRHEGREAVIEAWPDAGADAPKGSGGKVQIVSITTFLSRVRGKWGQPRGPYGLRFTGARAETARSAATRAKRHLGRPYDELFQPQNRGLYCAELIYEAFLEADGSRLFTLKPMTFGEPGSAPRVVWERYYRAREATIPEGQPGISPLGVYLAARRLGARPLRYGGERERR